MDGAPRLAREAWLYTTTSSIALIMNPLHLMLFVSSTYIEETSAARDSPLRKLLGKEPLRGHCHWEPTSDRTLETTFWHGSVARE